METAFIVFGSVISTLLASLFTAIVFLYRAEAACKAKLEAILAQQDRHHDENKVSLEAIKEKVVNGGGEGPDLMAIYRHVLNNEKQMKAWHDSLVKHGIHPKDIPGYERPET